MPQKDALIFDENSILQPKNLASTAASEFKGSNVSESVSWTTSRIDLLKRAFQHIINPPLYDQLSKSIAISEKITCQHRLHTAHTDILKLIDWKPTAGEKKPYSSFQLALLETSDTVARGLVSKYTLVTLSERNKTSSHDLSEAMLLEGVVEFLGPALTAQKMGKPTSHSSIELAEYFKACLEHPRSPQPDIKTARQFLIDHTIALSEATQSHRGRERDEAIIALKAILNEKGQEYNLVHRAIHAYSLYAKLNALTMRLHPGTNLRSSQKQ